MAITEQLLAAKENLESLKTYTIPVAKMQEDLENIISQLDFMESQKGQDIIKTNRELSNKVSEMIETSGKTKSEISEQIGIANQNFNKMMASKKFSLDDANRILNMFGFEAVVTIQKKYHE